MLRPTTGDAVNWGNGEEVPSPLLQCLVGDGNGPAGPVPAIQQRLCTALCPLAAWGVRLELGGVCAPIVLPQPGPSAPQVSGLAQLPEHGHMEEGGTKPSLRGSPQPSKLWGKHPSPTFQLPLAAVREVEIPLEHGLDTWGAPVFCIKTRDMPGWPVWPPHQASCFCSCGTLVCTMARPLGITELDIEVG